MSDDSSFTIYNRRQIIYNLAILVKNKCLVSVRFDEGKAFFLTAIINVDEANNAIVFDCGPKEELNQQLLNSPKVIFQADFSGIKCSFRTDTPKEIQYGGDTAFTVPVPESMFWMQRREYFRIKSPRAKGSYCRLIFKEREPVNLLLYDISLTGFSMLNTSAAISELLIQGAQFDNCRLVLTGAGEGDVSFKICSKIIINPNKIDQLKIQKIGCLFTKITPAFETIVQRYINQLQREDIQRTHG